MNKILFIWSLLYLKSWAHHLLAHLFILYLNTVISEAIGIYENNKTFLSLFCLLRAWPGSHQVGGSKIWLNKNASYTPFMARDD